MSYNIDSIDYLGDARLIISAAVLARLAKESCADSPESSFLDDPDCWRESVDLPGFVVLERLWWHGEGSGHGFDALKAALGHTLGSADLLLVWEGGDSQTGLRIVNGVVREMDVVFALAEKA